MKRYRNALCQAALTTMAMVAMPALGQGGSPVGDAWSWHATVYAWFPSINGTSNFSGLSGNDAIETDVNPESYLSRIQFAFMGTIEARRGPWSIRGDALYLNMGNHAARVRAIGAPTGNVSVPADVGTTTNFEGLIATFAGGYNLLQQSNARVDIFAGARYAQIKSSLDWEFSGPVGALARSDSVAVKRDLLDGIVGVRGDASLGANWFLPYYVDVGAGSSRFTWQAVAGIGYRFSWGDAIFAYRHLAYDFHSDRNASDISFSGPAIAASFRF